MASVKVGLVGLGEAGNLGDDLILLASVEAVYEAFPDADVSFLSFGSELDWAAVAEWRRLPRLPRRVNARFEVPFMRENRRVYRDRDLIVVGGGGLIQTSHGRDRPYGWLGYLPVAGPGTPRVLGVGLGFGPVTNEWVSRLRAMGSLFDSLWLRDPASLALVVGQLNWEAAECVDFIDYQYLSELGVALEDGASRSGRLGVAVRSWPGLTAEAVSSHVNEVANRHGLGEVVFYVLESKQGAGVDVEFTRAVANGLGRASRIRVYAGNDIRGFLQDMAMSEVAISMKLHSCAIWAARGVPMYPIFYAPKVSAFFGLPHHGLAVSDEIVQPVVPLRSTPRAKEALVQELRRLRLLRGGEGSRFGPLARLRFQVSSLVGGAVRKLWKNSRHGQRV